jgi:predicted dithiol-disulfide oxidoreductase (DUF899 family)
MKTNPTKHPNVVSPAQWLTARRELLQEEKEFTRLRDKLSAKRRQLPWVEIEKPYVFDGPGGRVSLAELFEGRSQLLVYHFMFGPGWEEGCRSCSFVSDHFDGTLAHLGARDTTLVAVSRAPLEELLPFKARMGWKFNWVSSNGNSFNHDFHVSFTPEEMASGKADYNFGEREIPIDELPGLSAFARDADGAVYRTYSTYSRGLDSIMNTYNLLDLTAKGRDEDSEATMNWVRYHDRYDNAAVAG